MLTPAGLPRRALARHFTASIALSALLLTGCGGPDDDGPSGSEAAVSDNAVVLTADQLAQVVLSAEAMGPGFKATTSDEDEDDDSDLGCLTDFSDELDEEEESDAESADAEYTATNDFELPALQTSAVSLDSVEEANDRFDTFREAIDGCERVSVTDEDDTTTTLDVTIEDAPYTNLVDEQLTVTASGSVEAGLEFPVWVEFSVLRVDNNVLFLAFTDLVEDAGDAPRSYATALTNRLTAVMAGEQPSEDLITVDDPGDVEGVPSSESTGAGSVFSKLPLDGGSYTWDSGVTMTLTITETGKYKKSDTDFCDPDCVAGGLSVVLKYEVAVPDNFGAGFKAYSCPGDLHVSDGSDQDAFSVVYGDNDRSIDGSVLPGTTKFGTKEYVINPDYTDSEFYIESSCGDDSYGESAFFAGTFA